MFPAFLHGWLLCLGLILPLGVQNVFVFNQGAQRHRWTSALPTVITAGVCDSLLILLAIGGVSVLVLKTPIFRYALSAAGIGFLLYMGWATWRSRPDPAAGDGGDWPLRRQVIFAASVSLLNPHAIIDTVGVVGPSSLVYRAPVLYGFTAGCLLNSWLWFAGLMTAGHFIGALSVPRRGARRATARTAPSRPAAVILRWFNRVSAVIMWACAVLLARSLW